MNTKPFRWTTWETWVGVLIIIVLGLIILANTGCRHNILSQGNRIAYCSRVDDEIRVSSFQCLAEDKDGIRCNRTRAHKYWAEKQDKEHHSHDVDGKDCLRWQ